MTTSPADQPKAPQTDKVAPKKKSITVDLFHFLSAPRCPSANALFKEWRKRHVPIPSRDDLEQGLAAIDLEKVAAPRLLALFQAFAIAPSAAKHLVQDAAEIMFERLGYLSGEGHQPDAAECRAVALDLIPKDASKGGGVCFDLFACFLHLALGKEWLQPEDVVSLLAAAFPSSKSTRAADEDTSTTPLNTLLSSPFQKDKMQPLLGLYTRCQTEQRELVTQVATLRAQLATSQADLELTGKSVAQLREKVSAQAAEINAHLKEIAHLQQQLAQTETAWQHRHDQIVGRTRGFLEGDLSRWLQTALEAADADPPYLPPVTQRLRAALGAIQSQLQWLSSV